jgi:soluble lytic murein transglycosylase-like protein
MFPVFPLRRRSLPGATALSALALLAACAGSALQTVAVAPDAAVASSLRAARKAVDMRQPRAQALSAKLVMLEWGTRGVGRSRLVQDAEQPFQSIDQIVFSATCVGCEQRPYHKQVLAASKKHGVSPSLIHAVIFKESGYNPSARSHRQAMGLMQITPETGRFLGVRQRQALLDPDTNIEAGTAYLKYLMNQHDSMDEVLAAYNAGSGNVRKYGGVPPFSETRRYLRDVKREMSAINTEQ